MLKNFIKTAFRNLIRYKGFSFINIIGLAIGMAVCILIMQYVSYEQSYDKFHSNYENIYRIQYNIYHEGELKVECAAAVPAVGPAMKDNFPEVLEFCRAWPTGGTMSYGEINFRENKMQVVSPSFIQMLSFPLVTGNPETALVGENKAVLTESTAKRFFGEEDPIGKTVLWNGRHELEVTGVCKDVPENSHIKFTFLFSYDTIRKFWGEDVETAWGWYDFNTYVLLEERTNHKEFDKKFDIWLNEELGERFKKYNGRSEFPLQPIEDIHLFSDLLQESEPDENGDGITVKFLTIIALFILLTAWINYINLATYRAINRAKEVGIRKVSGATGSVIIGQFLMESLILNVIAAFIAIILVEISIPFFSHITGVPLQFAMLSQSGFWIVLILIFFSGSFLSGLYPAFVISAFKPVIVLKGSLNKQTSGINLRKILVIFQFTISIALIAGTIIVINQLTYMKNRDLGVEIDETLVLHGPAVGSRDSLFSNKVDAFKQEIMKNTNILEFSSSTNVPGDEIFWGNGSRRVDPRKVILR